MEPNSPQSGEWTYDKKNKKPQKDLIFIYVSGKGQSFIVATLDGDVRALPFPTIKQRYSVFRLAQKHLTILMNNLFFHKVVKNCRIWSMCSFGDLEYIQMRSK